MAPPLTLDIGYNPDPSPLRNFRDRLRLLSTANPMAMAHARAVMDFMSSSFCSVAGLSHDSVRLRLSGRGRFQWSHSGASETLLQWRRGNMKVTFLSPELSAL